MADEWPSRSDTTLTGSPAPSRQVRHGVEASGVTGRSVADVTDLGALSAAPSTRAPCWARTGNSARPVIPWSPAGSSGVAEGAPLPGRQPASVLAALRPQARQRPAGTTPRCSFGVLGTGAARRKLPARLGRWQALGCLTAWARWQPLRGLPASALVKPCVEQPKPPCRYGGEQEPEDDDDQQGKRPVRYGRRRCGRDPRKREGREGKRRGGFLFLVHRSPGGRGRAGCGQPGGEVSGDRRQLRVGPRRQRLAHPQIQLIPVQPPLHERGFEGADHLLAVRVRCPQVTAASCSRCYLVSRPCHCRRLPTSAA
jgi:hypothetical protein